MTLTDQLKRLAEREPERFRVYEDREVFAMIKGCCDLPPSSDDCDEIAAELGFVIEVRFDPYAPGGVMYEAYLFGPNMEEAERLHPNQSTKLLATRAGLERAIELYLEGK